MSIPCIICHDNFDSDSDVIVLSCGHIYHGKCLEDWKKSSPQSRATCPLCRKQYDKRSIRKVYFNVEEPEINAQMESDLKRQKLISENLVHHNEKLEKEVLQKNMEIDRFKEAWLKASNELNKIRTDYGIKCQAFSIIDTVNNEYLQDNMKLKDENLKLKAELETIKQSKQLQVNKSEKSFVDLTCSNCESDDDIQIIENSEKSEVIEIIDEDSNDVFHSKLPLKKRSCNALDQNEPTSSDDSSRSAKKLCENDDYKRLEAFILSQI